MFHGQRPEITDVGSDWFVGGPPLSPGIKVDYGQVYSLPLKPPPSIKRAALIRYGVTTHHDDQMQRYVELPFDVPSILLANGTQEVKVLPPPSESVAPKEYYMLVVIDENDVPSPAERIHLQ